MNPQGPCRLCGGRAWGDVAHFPCLLPGSCISTLSRSIFSHHEHFLYRRLVAGGGCCCWGFALLCMRGRTARDLSSVSLSIITTSFSWFSSLSQVSTSLLSQSGFVTSIQILIHGSLRIPSFAKWHARVSDVLACSCTLSASSGCRVVDTARLSLTSALTPTV